MSFTRNSCDVVIAGAGIAAAATALRLCALGFRPLMLARTCRDLPGVEAIPSAAVPLFVELGAEDILYEAGAGLIEGFENHWNPEEPSLRSGYWIHVERGRLAKAAVREAVKRGARFRTCQSLPTLREDPDCVCIDGDGASLRFEVAIDATGRSAAWSRPIRRRGTQVADVYDVLPDGKALSGKIVLQSGGWAYRIGVADRTTVGMLSQAKKERYFPDALTEKALCLSSGSCSFIGRRPAFAQWAENPVQGRRIAVGDAALAYDPLAGQGIRFALSSAITASSVVNTWRSTQSQAGAAERFYRKYVIRCRESHFRFMDQLEAKSPPSEQRAETIPELVTFSGESVRADLQFDSNIRADQAFLLPDGECVRWIGEIDLLSLRNSLPQTIRSSDLVDRLGVATGGRQKAQTVMRWCLQNNILREAASEPGKHETSLGK